MGTDDEQNKQLNDRLAQDRQGTAKEAQVGEKNYNLGQGRIPPQTERMMQFFKYEHLPEVLQEASKPFCDLARRIEQSYPQNPERTVALRKLLEAKDAAVRSLLYQG